MGRETDWVCVQSGGHKVLNEICSMWMSEIFSDVAKIIFYTVSVS